MRRKLLFLVLILLMGMMGGCGQSHKEDKKSEEKEQKEELPMGGLGYYFAEDYEPSEFKQSDVDSDTVQWICAAYSIYTQYNRKDLGYVGGADEDNSEIYQRAIRIALEDGWRITDRDSAIQQLNSLLENGHREKYREFISEMEEHDLLSLSEEELLSRVERENGDVNEFQAAYRAYHAMGEKAVDAWDYSRALQILGDCYQAGYISLEECLDQSLAIAKKLQEEFDSWDEVCKSYLYGFHFWKKDDADSGLSDTADRWEVYEELKAMEEGPFSVPYDTRLEESWKDVVIEKEEEPKKQKKGVYDLVDGTDSIRVEVKTPKGFSANISDDEYMVFVERWDEKRESIVTLVYDISEIAPEEDILYGIRLSLAMSKQNGAENIEMGEIQTLDAEGQEVNYVLSTYLSNGSSSKKCNSWVMLDDAYMLCCTISENDAGGEFVYPEIEELLKEIYGGIQRKE